MQGAKWQLEDTNVYKKKLTLHPTSEYNTKINTVTDKFKKQNLITEKNSKFPLKLENPKTSKLNVPPNIHNKGNPGRPLVNSVNFHTRNLFNFVDHFSQPHINNLPLIFNSIFCL